MDPERARKVEELYEAGLGVESARRAAFLAENCAGDESLRREIESLLLHDDKTGSFLQVPALQMMPDAPRLAVGQRISHYEIQEKLGEGGMGVVYKARDSHLKRFVALKILPPEKVADPERKRRFVQEARSTSALNHPNIVTVYDIDQADDVDFIAMEYVEGETLEQLMDRTKLKLNEALEYAIQIADALASAHAAGIVHRDLKPGNVMVTAEGRVKVLDFGLAKLTEHLPASGQDSTSTEQPSTEPGLILGTVSYMSPEQAEGKTVDASSDVFSFGSLLYEMLTGRQPFRRETPALTLAAILYMEQPVLPAQIPRDLERVASRCLRKEPGARYGSAGEMHTALKSCQHSLGRRTGEIPWRRPAVIAAVLVVVLAAAALGGRWSVRAWRARWAERVAAPEISRLMNESRPLAALRLLRQAHPYAPFSPELIRLREELALSSFSIGSTPSGAEIYIAEYAAKQTADAPGWEFLGRSPLTAQLPYGYYRFRVVRNGFVPIEQAATSAASLDLQLHTAQETPAGMVWVPATKKSTGDITFPALAAADIPPFWIDQYEVTNREFKEFVARGGYRNREYWKQAFLKDGRTLSWEQAMAEFRDATGRPGPAAWQLGTYPEGKADCPVGGVSWYEAAAYAEFVGKSLPTVYHWIRAATFARSSDIANASNFDGQGPAPVGSNRGVGAFGTYDMAGNVKEWCWNLAGDRRYILGGGWNEPSYQFLTPDARQPFHRDATHGFRCIKHVSPPGGELTGVVTFVSRDRRLDKPADDQVYQIYLSLHSYDKTDLKPKREAADQSPPYWRTEDITFQAAYGNERVLAHLHLPKNASPPYQVVTFMGGVGILTTQHMAVANRPFEFVIRSGRAVIESAYKGTLERGPGDYYHLLGQSDRWREMNLQQSKDLSRSIDYLETRPDINSRKLAFFGYSYGAAMAPRLAAAESRIRCVVMLSGGSFEKVPAEVDSWNFAPRVKVPVLMVNGRDDFRFPLETSQLPLFRLLGTSERDKRHVLHEGGHLSVNGRPDIMKEILDWLDRYLGPVQTQ